MDEAEEIKLFEEYKRDAGWFQDNFDKLADEFEGKTLAVKNRKILASSDSIEDLIKILKTKGEDPATTYVSSIPPKDIIFIL